jgi:hypothetical protein
LISQQRIAFRLSKARLVRPRAPGKAVFKFAVRPATHLINDRGMDLPQGRQREPFRAKLTEENVAVFPHPGLRFTLRESQIEAGGGTAAHPATASTKGMDQPGIRGEKRVLDPGLPASRGEM